LVIYFQWKDLFFRWEEKYNLSYSEEPDQFGHWHPRWVCNNNGLDSYCNYKFINNLYTAQLEQKHLRGGPACIETPERRGLEVKESFV